MHNAGLFVTELWLPSAASRAAGLRATMLDGRPALGREQLGFRPKYGRWRSVAASGIGFDTDTSTGTSVAMKVADGNLLVHDLVRASVSAWSIAEEPVVGSRGPLRLLGQGQASTPPVLNMDK